MAKVSIYALIFNRKCPISTNYCIVITWISKKLDPCGNRHTLLKVNFTLIVCPEDNFTCFFQDKYVIVFANLIIIIRYIHISNYNACNTQCNVVYDLNSPICKYYHWNSLQEFHKMSRAPITVWMWSQKSPVYKGLRLQPFLKVTNTNH